MRRDEWLAGSLARSRPWEAEGISERTWYRRRRLAEVPAVAEVLEAPVAEVAPLAEVAEVLVAEVHEAKLSPVAPLPEVIKPVIESSYGPGRCAQCNGHVDGFEQVFVVGGARVLLHLECERFWLREDTRHPHCGGMTR